MDNGQRRKNLAAQIKRFQRLPLFFNGIELKEVLCVISLCPAGNMGVESGNLSACRTLLLDALGVEHRRLFGCRQTHSRVVALAEGDGRLVDADGLAGTGGAALSVTVADCLPVYLYDTVSGAFAICHSGWKGTGIAINALNIMKEHFGTKPDNVAALLGPCIQVWDYQVDYERASIFSAEFDCGNGARPLGPPVKQKYKKYFIDMQAANAAILTLAGVKNISVCKNSTFTDKRLGSFRREGKNFTKMMALIKNNKKII
ncbi:MAG: polyphenol oxidase family protein [Spirochaetaceae bacterium]|nr:polyphenol oxidase family protein [Spirochaetaceae bacterium]